VRLRDLIPEGAETGAGLALRHRGRYLFWLAGHRHGDSARGTFFAGIGGHCEPGEGWLDCVVREVREELGAAVEIEDAARSVHIGRDLIPRPVALEEHPRPLCVYELWNPRDAPFNKRRQDYTYYIVVYSATMDDSIEPQPKDVTAILWLTPEQVVRTAHSPQTLASLLESGARLVATESVPGEWPIRPQGTAHALAVLWQAQAQAAG